MWAKLHARLLCMVPNFKKTWKVCKNKFRNLFTNYKEAKAKNNILWQGQHDCKYYNSFEEWWSEYGSVMKHVSATTNNTKVYSSGDEELGSFENLTNHVKTNNILYQKQVSWSCFDAFFKDGGQ
jgi:transcription elongation factor GreA-like protein